MDGSADGEGGKGLTHFPYDDPSPASPLTDEQKLHVVAHLIAYALQVFYLRGRFIFLRSLLTMLNKQKALPNEDVAVALGMTDISYRVTVHRMKYNLTQFRNRLLQGEQLRLDDEHQKMAQHIYDDFVHLYQTLLMYYAQNIDTLKCAEEEVQQRLSPVVKEVGLESEEIKWQKVNDYTEERYERIMDVLFALLGEDKAKIRIFFRHRQFEPVGLTNEQRRKEYPKLYYQFIKNDFGLIHSNQNGKSVRVRLLIEDMPLKGPDRDEFLKAIYHLNELKTFQNAGIFIGDGDVAEVNSKKHLPLQVMDVVLGAMCFRLNDKHKERGIDGKRAKRNVVKEELYKYIRKKIWELHPGFNIGVTTPITKMSDLWERPYLHWNFVPKNFTKNEEMTKRHKTETAPYNLHYPPHVDLSQNLTTNLLKNRTRRINRMRFYDNLLGNGGIG